MSAGWLPPPPGPGSVTTAASWDPHPPAPLTPGSEGHCHPFHVALPSQVYQIYAKRSPEDVHALLRSFGTDYVILEDSICYERRHQRGCRLRDLLDVANGHVSTSSPRFVWGPPGCLYLLEGCPSHVQQSSSAFS